MLQITRFTTNNIFTGFHDCKSKIYLDQKLQKEKLFFKWGIDAQSFVGCVWDVEDDLGANTFALYTLQKTVQILPLFIDESHEL